VSRWKWYYWRLLGYAERLLQPLRGALPRRPQLLKPPRAVEQPKSEAAVKVASAPAKGREAKAAEGAGGRLGLEGLDEVDLE